MNSAIINEKKKIKEDWEWVKLGEVCDFIGGGTPSKKVSNYWGGNINWASVKDVKGEYLNATEDSISDIGLKNSASNIAEPNDVILVTRISPGKVIISNIRTAINQDLKIVKPKFKATSKFIAYYFKAIERELVKKSSGTTVLGITLNNLNEIKIPLLDIEAQQKIVSKIEELFSELDKGIENLRIAQQQLKTYRQAVLKWAFEGRLTNENVKEGELPKGWMKVVIGEVIDPINNGYTPPKEFLFEGSGEVPFIKVYNLNFNGSLNFKKNPTFIPLDIHQTKLKRSICYPGDVLINIVGPPLGKVSIVSNEFPEWNINQAIVMFRPSNKVLSKYISYFMQNPETIQWLENTSKATAGQWNVKVSTCREIPFPICSIKDQDNVIQAIECRLSVAEKMEESIAQSLQQADVLRQSILKMAFEGKLG